MYGISECTYCQTARDLLVEHGKEFLYFELEDDPVFLDKAKHFYDFPTVPIILENNCESGLTRFVGGCSDLVEFLDETAR